MSAGLTSMWRIKEAPQYQVEQTPGLWVMWGPCCNRESCPKCGGTNSRVVATCSFKPGTESPDDTDMVCRVTGLEHWTPERIQ
jgi:hypothetical protein